MVTSILLVYLGEGPGSAKEVLADQLTWGHAVLLVGFACGWPIALTVLGLYNPDQRLTRRQEISRIVAASALSSGPVIGATLSSDTGELGVQAVGAAIFFVLATTTAMLGVRELSLSATGIGTGGVRRVLIVGSGPRAHALYGALLTSRDQAYEVVGFVDSRRCSEYAEIEQRFLGALDELESILMHQVVDEVLIALPVRSCYPQIQDAISICERVGVESRFPADVFQSCLRGLQIEQSAQTPVIAVKVADDDYRLIVKRILDFTGACVLLVLLCPLMLLIAIALKLSSPGPVLFAQHRYGYKKRQFRMYKFRSMVANAETLQLELEHLNEASGPVFKIKRDPRITPLGRFLRSYSLDELPQLFNVLRGEMSLVGPRPLPPRDVHRFTEARLMRRFSVAPGMTCLWQISGRSNVGFDDWVAMDLHYIDHWSLWLDVKILARTLGAVLRGVGAS